MIRRSVLEANDVAGTIAMTGITLRDTLLSKKLKNAGANFIKRVSGLNHRPSTPQTPNYNL